MAYLRKIVQIKEQQKKSKNSQYTNLFKELERLKDTILTYKQTF